MSPFECSRLWNRVSNVVRPEIIPRECMDRQLASSRKRQQPTTAHANKSTYCWFAVRSCHPGLQLTASSNACKVAQPHCIGLDSFYLPGCMVLSLSTAPYQASEVHVVRREEALDLGKLQEVHAIYKAVIHGKASPGKAICQLEEESSKLARYPL